MKKILFFLLLFVNLHVFITNDGLQFHVGTIASAQHMYKEAGDNCYIEGWGWFYTIDTSDCDNGSSNRTQYWTCCYCQAQFLLFGEYSEHQIHCSAKDQESIDPYTGTDSHYCIDNDYNSSANETQQINIYVELWHEKLQIGNYEYFIGYYVGGVCVSKKTLGTWIWAISEPACPSDFNLNAYREELLPFYAKIYDTWQSLLYDYIN